MRCYVIVDVHYRYRRCSLSCFHSYFVFLLFALCVAIIATLLELLLIQKSIEILLGSYKVLNFKSRSD